MNNNKKIKFSDGMPMPNENEATYLGAKVTQYNLNKKRMKNKRVGESPHQDENQMKLLKF